MSSSATASGGEESKSAAQKVFNTVELYEMILLESNPNDILDNLSDAQLSQVVRGSAKLKEKLFLTRKPELLPQHLQEGDFRHHVSEFEPNLLLLDAVPQEPGQPWLYASEPFRIAKTKHEYTLYIRSRLVDQGGWDDDSDWSRHTFQLPRHPIATGVQSLPYADEDYEPTGHLPNVWVPAGKTLGDTVEWTEVFFAGSMIRSDVFRGIFPVAFSHAKSFFTREKSQQEGYWVLDVDGQWYAPTRRVSHRK